MNIQSACLLLSLCHAGSAAALGLGELKPRSFLGQPLHATITVLDAAEDTTAECFRLAPAMGGVASLPHAQLSLERTGAQTLLHIRTARSIDEPVAQFVLYADCEARLQRDYVLLLDPPLSEPIPVAFETAPSVASTPRVERPPAQRTVRTTPPPVTAAPRPKTHRARQPAPPAPRLVLSGRRMAGETGSAFALKLDTHLPDLARPLPEGLTATELSDENTALARKLAHLESQLVALQQRNAELEARRTRTVPRPAAVTPPAASPSPQWPLLLLITALLAGAGALIIWLRRRGRVASDPLDDTWTQPATASMPGHGRETAGNSAESATAQDDMPPPPERMSDIAPPTLVESTEIKDDILDQAEVYMAHGHANLAIHLLQEHLRDAPTESPVPWLLLLDLLHREGDTVGYAAASAECRRYFNVNLSDHPISQDNDSGLGLEAYPHLLDELVHVWNTPERETFFKNLIYDHRGGTRMGFKPAAYRDILLLRAIAQDTPLADAA